MTKPENNDGNSAVQPPRAPLRLTCLIAQRSKPGCIGKRQCQTVVVDKLNWAKSRALARLWESTFVKIDEVSDRNDIGATRDACFLLRPVQNRRGKITPT